MKTIGADGKVYSVLKDAIKEDKKINILENLKFQSYELKRFALVLSACTLPLSCK